MVEINGVEAEKAEAMRKYNNRRSFKNIIRSLAVALLCYVWFPMVKIAGDWFYRTGSVIVTNHTFVFFVVNLLIVSIIILSRDNEKSSSDDDTESDLYDQYTCSSTFIVTESSYSGEEVQEEDDGVNDLKKQIVPVTIPEVEKVVVVEEEEASREVVVVEEEGKREVVKGSFRRTKSEKTKKREVYRPVKEYRRTESAKMAMERMSSEEFRLKVETFIMEKKRSLVLENDVVECRRPGLLGSGGGGDSVGGYGSC